MSSVKTAQTQYPILDLIKNRWSARSFSGQQIPEETIHTIIEAASWAPSANNEQPWQYIVAHRGTGNFDKTWNALMGGNQPWTKQAAVLVTCIARKTFEANGKTNTAAWHDLGLANAQLILQARAMDIYSHIMGGFHADAVKQSFSLGENQDVVCIIALGYLDSPDKLEEPFKTRETSPRTRKKLNEIIVKS